MRPVPAADLPPTLPSVLEVLLVEDNPGDARLLREMILEHPEGGKRVALSHARTLAQCLDAIERRPPDALLLDLHLPDGHGIAALDAVTSRHPDLPVVVLTGTNDASLAARTILDGAQDYLVKGEVDADSLLRSLRYAVDHQQAERALAQSRRRHRALFEQALDAILLKEDNGRFIETNPAACKLTGYSREQILEKSVLDLVPEEWRPRVCELWRDFIRDGRSEGEIVIRRSDGSLRNVRYRGVADILPGVHLSFLTDVTEQRRTEERLRLSQRLEAVGQLAGGVAHDFNNLITAINGYSELCLEAVSQDDPIHPSLVEIRRAGTRAASLASQLLAFSRRQVLRPETLDLNRIVEAVETMLRRLLGEDVHLRTELAPGALRVEADGGQIEQVLLNLALNARDAMPRGGTLELRTAVTELTTEDGDRWGFAVREGIYVRLQVADDGAGMPPEVRDRVFEPFFTTKEVGQGTGLGLSTVYGIVKQSGGYVVVDTEVGRGSVFSVYLPRSDGEPESEEPPDAAVQAVEGSRGRETILVAEDEGPVRRLLVRILEGAGYTVLEAGDGLEAVAVCRRFPGRIHMVISDVVMPDLAGPELEKILAEEGCAAPVLFISGYPGETVVSRGDLAEGKPFLQKPFDQQTLLHEVRTLLDGCA